MPGTHPQAPDARDYRTRHIDEVYRTARTAIRGAVLLACVWSATGAVATFSGQTTSVVVQAGLSLFADVRFTLVLSLAVGAAGWAVLERRLRQRTVERLHGRIVELETAIDPARTTSHLTPKGKTNPHDRLR